ncbi:phosphotransferase family protein [Rhodococcus oxybenzonivorans]|uniref:phosphotransferase family protein n=1 Tax=Rhodococcus oxybenzonivorans TaxID=1990687 RepID=UPI002953168C|nr:phosphotransferase family protein [Rhodococcus oxybenzonivorans]MDV7352917.1 phosphotransferase family protein [Rhodococcus oxybenzonivorans]
MTEHRGLDLVALEKFLTESQVPLDGELRAELISGGKSNLTYTVFDDSSRWVLRRPPTAGLTPSAHDVAREYRVTSALQGTSVPVAATVALCEDNSVMGAPFTVVEHVTGQVIRTQSEFDALSDNEIDSCVDELVRVIGDLHNVDYQAVGLGEFGRPDGYVTRQVKLWAGQWARVKTEDSADVDRLHAALAESVPDGSESSIVHGDYRIDNTILSAADVTKVAAVVDWELSTLGDPLTDVALMCVYRAPAFDLVLGEAAAWTSPRMPSADDLAQRYIAASGRELKNWNFYLALANFKLAVIAQGIHHRYRAGATAAEGFDKAGEAVPALVDAGLRALKGRSA